MDKIEQLKQQKQYEAYVKKKTPQHNVWFNMVKAFFLGGMICLIGQCIYHFCELVLEGFLRSEHWYLK